MNRLLNMPLRDVLATAGFYLFMTLVMGAPFIALALRDAP